MAVARIQAFIYLWLVEAFTSGIFPLQPFPPSVQVPVCTPSSLSGTCQVPTPAVVNNVTVTGVRDARSPSSSSLNGDLYVFVDGHLTITVPASSEVGVDIAFDGLERVEGNFFIQDTGPASLRAVVANDLKHVNGSLVVASAPELVRVEVSRLQSVDENLVFRLLPELIEINLPELLTVGRTFLLDSCRSLSILDVASLELVGLHLMLYLLPSLPNVHLPSLSEVRWDFLVYNSLNLMGISADALTTIGEDLTLDGLPVLQSLHMPLLENIGEDCEFIGLVSLESLELPQLRHIGEDLELRFNARLQSVHFPLLTSVEEDLEVMNMGILATLEIPLLRFIGEDLEVILVPSLVTLSLPSLEYVSGKFLIASLAALELINVPNLRAVAKAFRIYNNPQLTQLSAPILADIFVNDGVQDDLLDGALVISYNDNLASLTLPSLQRIGSGATFITQCKTLSSIILPNLIEFTWLITESTTQEIDGPIFVIVQNENLISIELNQNLPAPGSFNLKAGNSPSLCTTSPGVSPPTCPGDRWYCAECGEGGNLNNTEASVLFKTALCEADGGPRTFVRGQGGVPAQNDLDEGGSEPFLRALCAGTPLPCPAEAPRVGDPSSWIDGDGCLDLSQMYGGVETLIGSIFLDNSDSVPCVVGGPTLKNVTGCVSIIQTGAQHIDFGLISTVGVSIFVESNTMLHELKTPELRTTEGELNVIGNGNLTSPLLLDFPNFQTAPLGVRIEQNPSIVDIDVRMPLLGINQGVEGPWSCFPPGDRNDLPQDVGDVLFSYNTGLHNLNLPSLAFVPSLVISGNDQNAAIYLPSLLCIDDEFGVFGSFDLASIFLPLLEYQGEDTKFFNLASLTSIALPQLLLSGEDIEIYNNAALQSVDAPLLETVGEDVEIFECWSLKEINFPSLILVDEDIDAYLLHSLRSLHLPFLKTLGEDLAIFGNPMLSNIHLPRLESIGEEEGGGILIENNHVLTNIHLPRLLSLGNRTARLCQREEEGLDSSGIVDDANGSCDGSEFIELYAGAAEPPAAGQRPVVIASHNNLRRVIFGGARFRGVRVLTNVWLDANRILRRLNLGLNKFASLLDAAFFFVRRDPPFFFFPPFPSEDNPTNASSFCDRAIAPDYARQVPAPGLREEVCVTSLPATGPPETECMLTPLDFVCSRTTPLGCTDAYYLYARKNAFDFEENAVYINPAPQFSAYRQPVSENSRTTECLSIPFSESPPPPGIWMT